MDFTVPLPKLKELCLIQTTICLWSSQDVVRQILDHEQQIRNKTSITVRRGIRRNNTEGYHLWTKFKEHVVNNLNYLPLPSTCKSMIIKYIDPIGCQIEGWLIDSTPFPVERNNFYLLLGRKRAGQQCHFSWSRAKQWVTNSVSPSQSVERELTRFYLARLRWTCLGVVDRSKLAPLIVRDERIKINHRYFVAYSHNLIREVYDMNHRWTREPLADFYEKHRDEIFDGKDFAVKFFWSSLSADDKRSLINRWHPHLISADTALFLLNRVKFTEQVTFLERGAYLRLLEWPYLHLFTRISKNYGELLPKKLSFAALAFLWEIVAYKGYDSVEGETFKSYLEILPSNVVLLFAAVRLTLLLFVVEYFDYTFFTTDFYEIFELVLEKEYEIPYDLKRVTFLLDIHEDFRERQNVDRDDVVRLIKSLITHYVDTRVSEMSDSENSVEECCKALRLELKRGPYDWELAGISRHMTFETKRYLLLYLSTFNANFIT